VLDIQLLDEASVTPEMDAAIRDCLCECFLEDVPIFSRQRAWHGSQPSYCLVGLEGNAVVGHVGVVVRTIRVVEEPVEIAGIQNMAIRLSQRGTGLGLALITAAMDEAAIRGIRFGLLFCVPTLEKYYARFGWVLHPADVRMDFEGQRNIPIPGINICMVKTLSDQPFPDGDIHLQGADW
jgi:predicted N-acetyltransferase YhbS